MMNELRKQVLRIEGVSAFGEYRYIIKANSGLLMEMQFSDMGWGNVDLWIYYGGQWVVKETYNVMEVVHVIHETIKNN